MLPCAVHIHLSYVAPLMHKSILFYSQGGQDLSAISQQFTQNPEITLQRQHSAPSDIGLSRQVPPTQDITQFTRQLSTPAPQDLSQQAQQQHYTGNPQYQGSQF